MNTPRYRACGVLLLVAVGVRPSDARWINRPSQEQRAGTPGLVHETFACRSMKTDVGYAVVLPPSYKMGAQRYPVVYWLHGGGGNECSSLFTARSWYELCHAQQVQEVILVYPNGFRSGYMDHYDGQVMVETMIIKELIPRVDERYRTISSRAGRAVHGFSMGASGSLKFAIKYPHLFSSAVAYGGGSIDLERSTSRFILDILKTNLNSDPHLVRQNNTYYFLQQNHAQVQRLGIRFLLSCGADDSWRKSAEEFQDALRAKHIPCQLMLVPETGHDLRKLSEQEGTAAALFQDRVFENRSVTR